MPKRKGNKGPAKSKRRQPNRNGSGQTKSAPSAVGRVITSQEPIVKTDGMRSCSVSHREYIMDLAASQPFNVQGLAINPGNALVFPWLSQIAQRFESYLFRNLRFCYETLCPSDTAGTVMIAVDYDVGDPLPADKQEMSQNEDFARSQPWLEFAMQCKGRNLKKLATHFVSDPTNLNINEDPKLYHLGLLEVAVMGFDGIFTGIPGELWVEYDVELMTPAVPTTGLDLNSRYVQWVQAVQTAGVQLTLASGSTFSLPIYGGSPAYYTKTGNLVNIVGSSTSSIILPRGTYRVYSHQNITSTSASSVLSVITDIRLDGTSVWDPTVGGLLADRPQWRSDASFQTTVSVVSQCTIIVSGTQSLSFTITTSTTGGSTWGYAGTVIILAV